MEKSELTIGYQPTAHNIIGIHEDGKEIGKLVIDSGCLTFQGNVDRAAHQFFSTVIKLNNERITELTAERDKLLEAAREVGDTISLPPEGDYYYREEDHTVMEALSTVIKEIDGE
jgi:hypothetical protein